jgi:hypothetical protein
MPQRYAREFRREICERLLAGERISKVDGMSAEDLDQVRSHPVVRYVAYQVYSPAQREAHFPASEEYYLAQARISDRRWKFDSARDGRWTTAGTSREIHELRCGPGD